LNCRQNWGRRDALWAISERPRLYPQVFVWVRGWAEPRFVCGAAAVASFSAAGLTEILPR
jgi:hypothetical protein